ncbi:hypothetical protein M3P21_16355 [Ruegeria sp. 2012CJ41-6]|uniref:Uncharacterized protein n=1 Tax=Ruegeria spongiae TaxID=2942209 RepID=A0ABT0Q7G3_9RHOB|nr:hypothetical protein [Ruegeria spongiae]MCL6285103.1 hypothetical protein [Ruegeria spongiae]
MIRATLAQTLTALADGATPDHPGLSVTEAKIDLPLLVSLEHGADGPVFIAHPPWSAFRSGFEPVAHRARLTIHEAPPDIPPKALPETATPATGPDEAT